MPFKEKIALITGGSKGIGKEIAKYMVKMGGSVCIVSRGLKKLQETEAELNNLLRSLTNSKKGAQRQKGFHPFVEKMSVDCTDKKAVNKMFSSFFARRGPPDYLINCVGYAHPDYIQDLEFKDFQRNMEVNYYGVLLPILATLPAMFKRKQGHIAAISSAMGFFGIMGYATYSPSKFAIVGLMEVLRNELLPHNISCSLLYPSDTKTPGFAKENQLKPEECVLMSGKGNVSSPEKIAKAFIKGLLKEKFHILPGESKLFWHLRRIFPKLFYKLVDKEYKKALKKVGKL